MIGKTINLFDQPLRICLSIANTIQLVRYQKELSDFYRKNTQKELSLIASLFIQICMLLFKSFDLKR